MGVVVGAALGVLWWQLAPRVPVIVDPEANPQVGYLPSEYIGADVGFAALAVIAGLAVTVGLIRMRRENLASVLASSLIAAGLGTAAMWFVGTRLGSVDIDGLAATATASMTIDAPLVVTLPGVFLLWPITAAAVMTIFALLDVWHHARGRTPPLP
jgi:hypothetical protein